MTSSWGGKRRAGLRFNRAGPNGRQWLAFIGAVVTGLEAWWDIGNGMNDGGRRGHGPYTETLAVIIAVVLVVYWLSGFTRRAGVDRPRTPVGKEMAETVKGWWRGDRDAGRPQD